MIHLAVSSVLGPYVGHHEPHSPVAHSEDQCQEGQDPVEEAGHTLVQPAKPPGGSHQHTVMNLISNSLFRGGLDVQALL